jgi:hypothetical protein
MTVRDTLMIAIPAAALIIVVASPGEGRWLRRPWFIKGPPRRGVLEAFCAILLLSWRSSVCSPSDLRQGACGRLAQAKMLASVCVLVASA